MNHRAISSRIARASAVVRAAVTAIAAARTIATWMTIATAMAIAIALGDPAAAAEVSVDIRPDDHAIVIEASAIVDADIASAWHVLTDYARYPDFVPGLRSSRVVARQGKHVTVEQTGVAPLWLLRLPMSVTYDIVESPPTSLRSRAVTPGAGVLQSTYTLTPTGAHGTLRLDYRGRLTVTAGPVAALREAAAEQAIADHFHALTDEMERQAGGRGPRMAGTMGAADATTRQ